MPTDKPFERRLKNDEGDEEPKTKRSEDSEDATEQATLLLNAKDAGDLFEFAGNDNKKFRKLFALVADLCSRQQGQASQLPAQPPTAQPRQPVIA